MIWGNKLFHLCHRVLWVKWKYTQNKLNRSAAVKKRKVINHNLFMIDLCQWHRAAMGTSDFYSWWHLCLWFSHRTVIPADRKQDGTVLHLLTLCVRGSSRTFTEALVQFLTSAHVQHIRAAGLHIKQHKASKTSFLLFKVQLRERSLIIFDLWLSFMQLCHTKLLPLAAILYFY